MPLYDAMEFLYFAEGQAGKQETWTVSMLASFPQPFSSGDVSFRGISKSICIFEFVGFEL